jgi:hypothetical protein
VGTIRGGVNVYVQEIVPEELQELFGGLQHQVSSEFEAPSKIVVPWDYLPLLSGHQRKFFGKGSLKLSSTHATRQPGLGQGRDGLHAMEGPRGEMV